MEQLHSEFIPELPLYSPLNLTKARKKIYLPQSHMAGLLKVKVQTYRSWESGRRNMPEMAWFLFWIQWKRVREKLKKGSVTLQRLDGRL